MSKFVCVFGMSYYCVFGSDVSGGIEHRPTDGQRDGFIHQFSCLCLTLGSLGQDEVCTFTSLLCISDGAFLFSFFFFFLFLLVSGTTTVEGVQPWHCIYFSRLFFGFCFLSSSLHSSAIGFRRIMVLITDGIHWNGLCWGVGVSSF
ncbi:hypothetical protein P170DRAFT_96725 [Aspergillus steynii IBT 23096]|uniref:Uncharacterized protein n=1 Tax=Aspergillus steynii IBT 23096 TaxID=1392250 RepID=A0A2I2GGW3_9EURO|nr:uncharacterized protein P170DRAFT_96725 [Aspergillus steynii IBT 23096]PLB52121.1 hypothetical protein P170DRAFT_96725 [Aspergillus steynii IBT 23096]